MNQGAAAWTSFDRIDRESDRAKSIETILDTGNFAFLESEALRLRNEIDPQAKGAAPLQGSINCNRFAVGSFNLVIKIEFSDAVRWIARILYRPRGEGDALEAMFLSEITTMRVVEGRTSIPVPKVYGFDASPGNSFGFPYMLIEEMSGRHLESKIGQCVPSEKLFHTAEQFAVFLSQLSTLRFDRIGRLWSGWKLDQEAHIIGGEEVPPRTSSNTRAESSIAPRSSLEHFFNLGREQRREILALRPGNRDYEAAALVLEQSLSQVIQEDYIHGPFPIHHQDMHYNNMLFDDEYNITAVLDWDGVETAPVEEFVVSNEFITYPGLSAAENAPITEFRSLVTKALRDKEGQMQTAADPAMVKGSHAPGLADLIESPRMELMHRSRVAGMPVRALPYAQLCLRLTHGADVQWEAFRDDILSAPIHRAS